MTSSYTGKHFASPSVNDRSKTLRHVHHRSVAITAGLIVALTAAGAPALAWAQIAVDTAETPSIATSATTENEAVSIPQEAQSTDIYTPQHLSNAEATDAESSATAAADTSNTTADVSSASTTPQPDATSASNVQTATGAAVTIDEAGSDNEADSPTTSPASAKASVVSANNLPSEEKEDTTASSTDTDATALAAGVKYEAHVQDDGWQDPVTSDETAAENPEEATPVAGTKGESRRLEALTIELVDSNGNKLDNAVEYKAHIANEGWDKSWSHDGERVGTTGKSRAIEAIKVRLTGDYASLYDILYRVHVQDYGWLAWTGDGEAAGSVGLSKRVEAIQLYLSAKSNGKLGDAGKAFIDNSKVTVNTHVQDLGWTGSTKSNGQTAGTTGQGKRVEALTASLSGYDLDGDILYRTHVQDQGWGSWVKNGAVSGTTGKSLRVEAVQFELEGEIANSYDLYYRVHVADYGWLDWVEAGKGDHSIAGTTALGKRVEAIQLRMFKKGDTSEPGEGIGYVTTGGVSYSTMKSDGTWSSASNGGEAGSTGQNKPIVAMKVTLGTGFGVPTGTVTYRTHVSNTGWESSVSNGATAGLATSNRNVEALSISLDGTISRYFDVYYRVHYAQAGWLGWAKNGEDAGITGLGFPSEALEVMLVAKGNAAPGSTADHYYNETTYPRYGQTTATANAAQLRVRNSAYSTPATPAGYCSEWTSRVISNAGYGYYSGDARDQYWRYCHSSDLKELKVGMVVAVSTHTHSYMGGIYGHIGMYVGDGIIRDSVYGYVRTISVKEWIEYYGTTVTPKWGWLGNVKLA